MDKVEAEQSRRQDAKVLPATLGDAGATNRDIPLDTDANPGRQSSVVTSTKEFISLREFARRQGISLKAVQKAIASGRLKAHDTGNRWPELDYKEARSAWKNSRIIQNNNQSGKIKSDFDGDIDGFDAIEDDSDASAFALYNRERAKNEQIKREKAEIELAALRGEMHHAEDVETVLNDMLTAFRAKILSIPTKLAARVLGQTDIGVVQSMLTEELYEALAELSEYDPEAFSPRNEDHK